MIKSIEKKTKSKTIEDTPILSFFTGAGLLDLGFSMAGFEVVWRNELCRQFIEGFEFGMSSMGKKEKIENTNSIIDLGPNQILKEAFNNTPRSTTFGIIGGPPCPDFSVGGKNNGQNGHRGKLSLVFTNRILETEPTFFLFENVPGLVRTIKHKAFLLDLMGMFSKLYLLDLRVVNALDYGVPQDRERMILVGFHRKWVSNSMGHKYQNINKFNKQIMSHFKVTSDEYASSWFPWECGRKYKAAKKSFTWPDKSPFGSTTKKPRGLPEDLLVGPLVCNQKELKKLPNGEDCFVPYSDKFKFVSEGDVSRKCFKRLHRWRFSPAVAYGNNEVHLHPVLPRRLSVREAMRIQTVPDNYALPEKMPLTHKFKTVGNGVPVQLSKALAEGISAVLRGEKYADI